MIGVTTSELRPSGLSTLRRQGEPAHPEMALGMTYLQRIEAAGAVPVVLPPCVSDLEALLARLDGICLSGGPDLDPDAYGARERHEELGPTEPTLDALRARARPRGARARDAGAGHLPRLAGAQRRVRRHAAPASARPPADGARHAADPRGRDPGRHPPRRAARRGARWPSTPSTTRRSTASATGCACRRARATGRSRASRVRRLHDRRAVARRDAGRRAAVRSAGPGRRATLAVAA